MEVKKPNKEIPIIHSNPFIYNNPSSSPSPPPLPPSEKKTLTLDPSHQARDPSPSPSPSPNQSPRAEMIRYRECQRNHAAHLGNHVVDGCGEFMPSGEEGTHLALKCAACDCHRNFHRREVEGDTTTTTTTATTTTSPAAPLLPLPPPGASALPKTTNCYISFSKYHKNNTVAPPVHHLHGHHPHSHYPRASLMMAFGSGGAAAESSSDDLNAYRAGNLECGGQFVDQYGVSKKRFRTKFTQEQKDKMMEFAEKLGWKIQKQDDVEVQRFCSEVGVKRQVFKVWMHNNKQAMKKKQASN